jgi:hypothetical protein
MWCRRKRKVAAREDLGVREEEGIASRRRVCVKGRRVR